mmetsp:Transcript_118355/g.215281  ORF Transcript_118355/g.215281 Transcript_118355/m.215281 type:complete len:223 (+) Transcript_118355:71-739(+)
MTSDPGSSSEAGAASDSQKADSKEVRWSEFEESDKEEAWDRKKNSDEGAWGTGKQRWKGRRGEEESSGSSSSAAAFPELPKTSSGSPSDRAPNQRQAQSTSGPSSSKQARDQLDPKHDLRKYLSGTWCGGKGETYEIDFNTLQCTRTMPDGSTYVFKLEWLPDERAVKWGVSFVLYADELKSSPGKPVWHGMKRKGSYFQWKREKQDVSHRSLNPPNWQKKR